MNCAIFAHDLTSKKITDYESESVKTLPVAIAPFELAVWPFHPRACNELLRLNISRERPPTATLNLIEIFPTHGNRASRLLSDRRPSFLLHPESRSAEDPAGWQRRRKYSYQLST